LKTEFDALKDTASMVVSGWGTTSQGAGPDGSGGLLANKLQHGFVTHVPYSSCTALKNYWIDPNSMLWCVVIGWRVLLCSASPCLLD